MFITQCNISCIFLFSLPTVSLLLMLSMPQKSRSRSTLTQKNEEKYQRNKEKQEKKKNKPWAATTICSKFTFFSVLLPDKALIKTAMCSVKLVLVLVTSFFHTYIFTSRFRHIYINIQIHPAMWSLFQKTHKKLAEILPIERTLNASTLRCIV